MKRARTTPGSIAPVIDAVFRRIDPRDERRVYGLWTWWDDVVGEAIARRAQPARFHGGVLSVRVNSQAWMQELQFMKEDLRERLNARLGAGIIRDIYFVSGLRDPPAQEVARPAPRTVPASDSTAELPPLDDPSLATAFQRVLRAHRRRRG